MRYEFHPEALDEFEAAAKFYSGCQNRPWNFDSLRVSNPLFGKFHDPARWRVLDEDVRRCLVHVFPYAVLYTVESDYVLILAVMHCSREPGYRRHRIQA
jgi:toxin ParE1/3/4